MVIHTALNPCRAETYLGHRRAWAEATAPHETMADVLAHLARLLLGAGVPGNTDIEVKPVGQPAHAVCHLRSVAVTATLEA